MRRANKLQRKCEKRPWSDLDRQRKYLKLRVIKGSRPNDSGVEMVQWSFWKKNREGKWVLSRRTCLKETTVTTRSCQTGSDFSYNAAATTADSSHDDPYWKIVTKEILKHGSRSLPFFIVGVTLCWVFRVQWGCHYLIFSTHLVQLRIRKRQVYFVV